VTPQNDREEGLPPDPSGRSANLREQIRKLLAASGLGRGAAAPRTREGEAGLPETDGSEMAPQRLTDGFPRQQAGRRLLRVGLFGEFSTGKSSLANLLLGGDVMPTAVLANTRRPTMASYAPQFGIEAIHQDGSRTAIAADAMGALAREDIRRFDLGMPSELLRFVKLLDTAGFADPYQDTRQTLQVADEIDICIWCTLATQAWRESEQRTWRSLPARLRISSILVVTHIDNIVNDRDRERLESRLRRETGGLFGEIVPLSVLDAMRARGANDIITDPKLWQSSGGARLLAAMRVAVANLQGGAAESGAHQIAVSRAAVLAKAVVRKAEVAPPPRKAGSSKVELPKAESSKAGSASVQLPGIETGKDEPKTRELTTAPPGSAAAASPVIARAALTPSPDSTVRPFLRKVVATVPSCLSAAWVDLTERQVTQYANAGTPDAIELPLAAAVANMFQGEHVQRIEAMFKASRPGQIQDHHYFKEIVVIGQDYLSIMLRNPAQHNRALIIATDMETSLGLVLTTVRGLMNASAVQLKQ
jgi:hypothetical protein